MINNIKDEWHICCDCENYNRCELDKIIALGMSADICREFKLKETP